MFRSAAGRAPPHAVCSDRIPCYFPLTVPEDDPDKLMGPGGLSLRQIHEQVKKSVERDREAQVMTVKSAPAQQQSRWQRLVRWLRDRKPR